MDLQIIGFLCEIEITQLWISIIDLYYYSSNSFFFTYSEYSQSSNIWAIRHCTFWQCLIFSLKQLTIVTWLLQYMKLQHTHWNIWKYSSQISKQLHCEFCFHVALSSLILRKKAKISKSGIYSSHSCICCWITKSKLIFAGGLLVHTHT